MRTSFSQFDGPRLLRGHELAASQRLEQLCFGEPETSPAEAPANYTPPWRGGMYVLAHQGKLVSQIGVFHDKVQMYAGFMRTASIGGVCTHPDYRNQGLASHLLEYCTQEMVRQGARLMLISGDAGVYIRLGNVPYGRYQYFSIQPGQTGAWRPTPAGLTVRRMTTADILPASRLYQAEPVLYLRKHADFAAALQHPLGNSYIHADQWMVERSGQALAYLLLGCPYEVELQAGIRHVAEYAGSRLALVEVVPALLRLNHLKELSWPVAWQEQELAQLLQDCGVSGAGAPLEGYTLRIVDFPGFMQDLRPILQARLGAQLLRGLRFEQSGARLGGTGTDRYTIVRGSDRLDLDGAAMTRLVMGTAESETQPPRLPGALAEVVPALFPMPSFLPGINYR